MKQCILGFQIYEDFLKFVRADNILKLMIHKLTSEKPQSDIVRLPSPMLLQSGSGFGQKAGIWDDELLLSPEVFDTEVIIPDTFQALL